MVFGELLNRTNYYTSHMDGVKFRKLANGMSFKGEGFLYKFEEWILKNLLLHESENVA